MDKHPIKVWRDGKALSQEQAGVQLEVDAMTISRWERGEHLPRKKHWTKIEEVTGITPSQLVSGVRQHDEVSP